MLPGGNSNRPESEERVSRKVARVKDGGREVSRANRVGCVNAFTILDLQDIKLRV